MGNGDGDFFEFWLSEMGGQLEVVFFSFSSPTEHLNTN